MTTAAELAAHRAGYMQAVDDAVKVVRYHCDCDHAAVPAIVALLKDDPVLGYRGPAPVPPGETRRQEVIATANRLLDEVCGPRLPAPAAHPETTPARWPDDPEAP